MKQTKTKVSTPSVSRRTKLRLIVLALAWIVAPAAQAGNPNLKFDEYLKQGIVQNIRGDSAGALASFKVAAFICTINFEPDYNVLLRNLVPVMRAHPLDPSGHIAIGLLYDRYCGNSWTDRRERYADFDSASENEMRYAIALSPNHQNYEAQRILDDWFKSPTELEDPVFRRETHDCYAPLESHDLTAQLLADAWEPEGTQPLVTTIGIAGNPAGEFTPEIEIPSLDKAHDDKIISSVRKVMNANPYPNTRQGWRDQTFSFYSSINVRSVNRVTFSADYPDDQGFSSSIKPNEPTGNLDIRLYLH